MTFNFKEHLRFSRIRSDSNKASENRTLSQTQNMIEAQKLKLLMHCRNVIITWMWQIFFLEIKIFLFWQLKRMPFSLCITFNLNAHAQFLRLIWKYRETRISFLITNHDISWCMGIFRWCDYAKWSTLGETFNTMGVPSRIFITPQRFHHVIN